MPYLSAAKWSDFDFCFCQRCGYHRKILKAATIRQVPVDLDRLRRYWRTSPAAFKLWKNHWLRKTKGLTLKGTRGFLFRPARLWHTYHCHLPLSLSLSLCRFVVYKDNHGRTQVHRNSCSFMGQRRKHPCSCPMRLSYKTVDSYIGRLRSVFHANGRNGEWDRWLGLGNPAADNLVKDYLRLVTAEQLQTRVTPKQATPFFVDKLTGLAEHLQRSLGNAKSNIERFIVARDQAYFKTAVL